MDANTYKRFRIIQIEGPSDRGLVNQFHDYVLELELDPGAPYEATKAKVLVTLFDSALFGLEPGDARVSPHLENGQARITQYVINQLLTLLPFSSPAFPLKFNPTVDEIGALRKVDPTRVDINAWNEIAAQPAPIVRQVFISCGQRTDDEIALGKAIAEGVKRNTGLEGYFAEYQHSLDGLTRNIFNALHSSSGFIAVMHRRDQRAKDELEYRGSIWIEQEIAIAAFLVQSLGLRLPARVYTQKGIARDGVRGYIHLNPIEFEKSDEVLKDLETFWSEFK